MNFQTQNLGFQAARLLVSKRADFQSGVSAVQTAHLLDFQGATHRPEVPAAVILAFDGMGFQVQELGQSRVALFSSNCICDNRVRRQRLREFAVAAAARARLLCQKLNVAIAGS